MYIPACSPFYPIASFSLCIYTHVNIFVGSVVYINSGQFEVLRTGPNLSAIKLRNVAQPHCHLAVIGGYFVGYVSYT